MVLFPMVIPYYHAVFSDYGMKIITNIIIILFSPVRFDWFELSIEMSFGTIEMRKPINRT